MQHASKPESYFSQPRDDIAALITPGPHSVLEIGCGSGATGLLLKNAKKAKRLVGVEVEPELANAAGTIFDQVICGNIEEIVLPDGDASFDYVVCGDVLEHLRDPWRVLLRLHQLLKPRGFLVASIPNVRNRVVLQDLIFKGEWRYREDGILDSTHLRFFTKKSMRRLFEETGYRVAHIEHFRFGPKATILNAAAFGLLEEFLAQRYLIRAQTL
jgi:2-polyprenyl-3-methyl-5-hydroxy-6-metoxy-1,4-benzoquinol methylase